MADFLVRLCGTRNDGAGEVGRQTFLEPLERKQAQVAAGHVDDAGGVFALRNRGGIVRRRVMAGREDDVGGAVAAGERASSGGSGGECGGDAGNDFEGDVGRSERGHLFGGAAKDEGIAALEADDAAMGAGVLDHERVDFFLGNGLCAAALAHVDNHCVGRRELKDCRGYEVIVEDDVGGLDEAEGLDGEQIGIAGPCTDKVDAAFGRRVSKSNRRSFDVAQDDIVS